MHIRPILGQRNLEDAARVIIYGAGMMGCLAARYAQEKGAKIVAFYRRSAIDGASIRREFPDAAFCTPDVPLARHAADLVLMTHCTRLRELEPAAMAAAAAGLDVLTIAEHAYEPFYDDGDLPYARAIDLAFKAAGKRLVSVGVQDSFWFAQPMAFLSAVQNFRLLEGLCAR